MIGIVVSEADEASVHIGEHLLELAEWTESEDGSTPPADGGGTVHRSGPFELRTFQGLHIELEGVAAAFDDAVAIVFASRHSGETGPLLTAHFTGNAGAADFGGRPGELATAWPAGLDRILASFRRVVPDGYAVGMECTHHGPTDLDVPSMFVEIGSGEAQWRDTAAARAAATAILDLEPGRADRIVVGFGGGHYAPRFERIGRETGWAVGHVIADWGLDAMESADRSIIRQAFERSGASRAVIEGERPSVASTIEALGYRTVSETWVRETDSVPLPLVDHLEANLRPVDEGLRFGDRTADPDDLVVYEPPADLLADLQGIDSMATREAVAAAAVAFETAENGNRIEGRIALPDGAARSALIDGFAAVLRSTFDAVERVDDTLVVTESAFDPDRARELGVPEGPAFGELAEGRAVEVDGETVSPETVHIERERRYRL